MNILIITGKFGMGHYSAANALSEKISSELKDANVFVEDLFVHLFKTHCSVLYRYFHFMASKGNRIYNWAYRRTENSEKRNRFPMKRFFLNTLDRLIRNTNADVVISTLPVCSQLVSDYKRAAGRKIFFITCITDVVCHPEWIYPQTDLYLVAAPAIKDRLIQKGVSAHDIMVSGIPVRSHFKPECVRGPAAFKQLLIMGGGLGLLPKSKTFYEELSRLPGIRTTIITGKNKTLYHMLHGRYPTITVLAYVDNVYKHMHDADLIISKPGGITLYEAIFAELPFLMFIPFLEQEIRNGNFVLENNLGLVLSKAPEDSVAEIQSILYNNEMLGTIRSNMQRFKSCLDIDGLPRVLLGYEQQRIHA